jgi:hypothetical protein
VPPQRSRGKQRRYTSIKNCIVGRVSEVIKGFGHIIKVEDSFGSETYFAFSKATATDTIELPQTFRKIQKAYGANNAFLPTLDEFIGATFSNAHSACRVGTTCTAPYAVALFWSLMYLCSSVDFQGSSISALCALLMIPSVVGGFPIIYLHNMYVRAESDLLSPFLSLCSYTNEHYPEIGQFMHRYVVVEQNPPSNMTGLWMDPYSIRVGRPMLPSSRLRLMISQQVIGIAKNKEVRALIQLAQSHSSKLINDCLESATPCNVKVLSNVYAASPEGVFHELIRKFETGRSVMELLILNHVMVLR